MAVAEPEPVEEFFVPAAVPFGMGPRPATQHASNVPEAKPAPPKPLFDSPIRPVPASLFGFASPAAPPFPVDAQTAPGVVSSGTADLDLGIGVPPPQHDFAAGLFATPGKSLLGEENEMDALVGQVRQRFVEKQLQDVNSRKRKNSCLCSLIASTNQTRSLHCRQWTTSLFLRSRFPTFHLSRRQ